jgi:multiple RNA-binding domain-containing protein 1
VANAIADQYQVKKSDIFNPEADNMAVRMALAEAQIIQETKNSLEQVRYLSE